MTLKEVKPLPNEVEQHLAKLRKYLDSDALDFESRLFILSEIWDIRIDAKK